MVGTSGKYQEIEQIRDQYSEVFNPLLQSSLRIVQRSQCVDQDTVVNLFLKAYVKHFRLLIKVLQRISTKYQRIIEYFNKSKALLETLLNGSNHSSRKMLKDFMFNDTYSYDVFMFDGKVGEPFYLQ